MNGLLIVNKPAGMTSHDVVARLRKITGERSIGHLGTLDPFATGVLPMLLGRFTRLARFFSHDRKRYTGTIHFGQATDTYDSDGEPTGTKTAPLPTLDDIRTLARTFTGEIDQLPPPFSAKKLHGVPAYKLSREGKPVVLRPVKVQVFRFEIASYEPPFASFEVEVSAGCYVRSLAHDMGRQAGCGAHLSSLCRTQAGDYALRDSATLEEIAEWARDGSLSEHMPHPRNLLKEIPAVSVDEGTAMRLRNGMVCNVPEYSNSPLVRIFTGQRDLFAIGRRVAGTLVHPTVVLA